MIKKLVLASAALLAICTPATAYLFPPEAKGKIPDATIDGVGILKIGMSHDDFLAKARTHFPLTGVISFQGKDKVYKPGAYVMKGVINMEHGIWVGNFDPLAKAYFIKPYAVAGMNLELEAVFYKEILIYLNIEGKEIQDAFITKYGTPNNAYDSKQKKCSLRNGPDKTIDESITVQRWKNKDIDIMSIKRHDVSYRCELSLKNNTEIKHVSYYNEYLVRNNSFGKGKLESERKQKAKSELQEL